jgi:hypothetical protein
MSKANNTATQAGVMGFWDTGINGLSKTIDPDRPWSELSMWDDRGCIGLSVQWLPFDATVHSFLRG